MAGIIPGQRIIDLACGTGAIIKLILQTLRNAKESVIIGVDQSASALKEAMEELSNVKNATLEFAQSKVEHLSHVVKESVDTIILCNAIHYINDKHRLVEEVQKTLKPKGVFAFNTSFFEGGHPPGTEKFYGRWMLKSLRALRNKYGLKPNRSKKVEARRHLSPEQYEELLTHHGMKVRKTEIRTVQMPLEGWLDISQFEDFITGIMPGVPLDKASESLQQGVKQTYEDLNITTVPRNWLYMVASRT